MKIRWITTLMLLLSLTGCSIVPGGNDKTRDDRSYLLDVSVPLTGMGESFKCLVVVLDTPEPAPGYSGAQMYYTREANRLERFAYSRWAAAPGRMIAPLVLRSLRETNAFNAVLSSPAAIVADLRVEMDELRLVQDFYNNKSEVQFSVSTRIYAPRDRRLLESEQFSYRMTSDPDPASGVRTANQAVERFITDFSDLVGRAATSLGKDCSNTP